MNQWTPDAGLAARPSRVQLAESQILTAIRKAMTAYLREVTRSVLGPGYRPPSYLVAQADAPPPDMDAWPPPETYMATFDATVSPMIAKVFGEAFAAQARSTALSDTAARLSYMQNVHDRLSLNLWQSGVFEQARAELVEGINQGESVTQLRDRVGSVTHIDAYSRRIRAEINAQRRIRDAATSTAEERADARAALRALYPKLDETDLMWHYQARRVARTETMGALNGGSFAGAKSRATATGRAMYKKWLSHIDHRTRDTHKDKAHGGANGQIQPIDSPFLVGDDSLDHPGDPNGSAGEVINCRCTVLYLSEDEAIAGGYDPNSPALTPTGGST